MRKIAYYLKTTIVFCIAMISYMQAHTQTATPPSIGDGSESNPYQIATLENLYWLTQNNSAWDKYYIQTADIDASPSISWNNGSGFTPIGSTTNRFNGTYKGRGFTVNGIYINRPDDECIGLFGFMERAYVDSLGVTNVNIIGKRFVGGLAGYLHWGKITNCYTTGMCNCTIAGYHNNSILGGLVGINNDGEINFCNSDVDVSTFYDNVGGLVGSNTGIITHSYSFGEVIGNSEVGGLTGTSSNKIQYCYSQSNVTSNTVPAGGLVSISNSEIKNCYSKGSINIGGGLIGSGNGSVSGSFWDIETSGLNTSSGGIGLTTTEMKNVKNYVDAGWDFMDETVNGINDLWGNNNLENNGFPFLSWQGFTNVSGCEAPYSPAEGIVFGNILTNSINLKSLTKYAYGTSGYSIYINSENTWTVPVDGTQPISNTSWQNSGQQCIYFGPSISPNVIVDGLLENTKYYFKVYAYNDCSGTVKYEQKGTGSDQFTAVSNKTPEGDGSDTNPYIISDLENLTWIIYNDSAWGKHFIQSANIDASLCKAWDDGNGFIPIGDSIKGFDGSYNGRGYIIDQIFINRSGTGNIGLFGVLSSNAHIDSLGLTHINIEGGQNVGGIAGLLEGGQITNCYSTGKSKSFTNEKNSYHGGLVGLNKGDIRLCTSSVIVNSLNNHVGGLIGSNAGVGTISFCYTDCNVTGGRYVGGVVGSNADTASITQCYSQGNVQGDIYVGNCVGISTGKSTITNSFSQGNVTGNNYVGGFLGNNSSSYPITYCYSRSWVNSIGYSGGLTGMFSANYSFWDVETSGQPTSGGGIGLTTIEMKDSTTYLNSGWDFIYESLNGTEDIWGIDSILNNGYPYFNWQEFSNECQAPIFTARSLVFGDTTINSIILDSIITSGYNTGGYCIYINTEDSWVVPVDGTEPTVNTSWQNNGQQCIYFGASNNLDILIAGLLESKKYYFKVFAYNDCSGVETYEQNGILVSQYTKDNFLIPEGDGSEGNPYKILNSENLVWLMKSDTVWDKHFIQTANIDASSSINWDKGKGFIPIGNVSTTFTGSYNGGGNEINGINIDREGEYNIGFFGYLQENARIKNLGLTNIEVIGGNSVGGLVGTIDSDETHLCVIIQCFTQGNIAGNNSVGGLVGYTSRSSNGEITNCYTKGIVLGTSAAGGLLGSSRNYTIKNCYSNSNVSSTYSPGGLIGSTYNTSVENCFWDIETSGQSSSMGGGYWINNIRNERCC